MLVRAGADVNHFVDYGWSPLRYACFNYNTVIARCLLRYGARMDEEWEGFQCNVARQVRADVMESMGGPEGVAKAHLEWLACAPGRRTKAAR